MKLFIVQESFLDEDIAQVTEVIANGLAARQHNITLVTLTGKPIETTHYSPRVTSVFLGKARAAAAAAGVARLVEKEKPDVILSHGTASNIACLTAVKTRSSLKVPVAITLHSSVTISEKLALETQKSAATIAVPLIYREADRIICTLKSIEHVIDLCTQVPSEKSVVLYNPLVEMNVFETAAAPIEEEWFEAPGASKVVSVGSSSNHLAHHQLLQAMAISRYKVNLRAYLLGQGKDQEEMRVLASSLALDDIVTMPGVVAKPERFLRAANVYVSTSQHDSVSGELVRAMALGTPVVAIDSGAGAREVLRDVRNGWLVPFGEADKLSEAIIAAVKCDRSDDTLATRARDFSQERTIDTYEKLLVSMIAERVSDLD
ncbi:N-acetylgalactosamine-N,N'-diacetylbacillosaminyl-diphospho-undecaprenol 4-alpha-N-acetylgalactosaminyltransferase [Pseudovibrio axinellae]|uniref:N-acetylgalactosamine-N, N'-diacetylbacillosaminyl-diphospho-undecaprenol 4-alpha-N-acetylgalactosaminyltransferase n=1 Tax=Pseudovibrio axinellae TaxID=989403 RepID=A0A165U1S0_9HYPH|nr:glycosyltransferase [Pseudovibrio axinellae]KZL09450.1 N-acetylgalactosamine-N,N'-diacetylbacillosaminyl-diphospho-undecaprenol 4-alpha-N-acetylgalactosaminyltransferase [Pseudovibrio axinellae]SEQ64516.1 Glycosyltransferase involved in cell wall bisynthesis [Pseudovibrio axinellae]